MSASPPHKRKRLGVEQGVLQKPFPDKDEQLKKKARKRTRTTALRKQIVEKIECALRSEPCSISHLFTSLDESGTPQASLSAVLSILGVSDFSKLSPQAILSLSRFTHTFSLQRETVTKDDKNSEIQREPEWMITYRPVTVNPQECMVYLDNLPSTVSRDHLLREVRKFGTVVQIRLPTRARKASTDSTFKPLPRPRGFAFVKFTEPEAVHKICQEYLSNLPLTAKRKNMNRIILLKERRFRKKENALSTIFHSEKSNAITTSKSSNGQIVEEKEMQPVLVASSLNKNTSQEALGEKAQPKIGTNEGEGKKKKRRKRKRKERKKTIPFDSPAYIEGPVRKYFQKMQAMPFVQYRELRAQYFESQKKIRCETRNKWGIEKKKFTALCAERDANWKL